MSPYGRPAVTRPVLPPHWHARVPCGGGRGGTNGRPRPRPPPSPALPAGSFISAVLIYRAARRFGRRRRRRLGHNDNTVSGRRHCSVTAPRPTRHTPTSAAPFQHTSTAQPDTQQATRPRQPGIREAPLPKGKKTGQADQQTDRYEHGTLHMHTQAFYTMHIPGDQEKNAPRFDAYHFVLVID